MPSWKLKLLYDGDCPFCRREVAWLERRDRAGRLATEDIAALGFDPSRYGLTREEVTSSLHGIRDDGTIVRGMDAVRAAYRAAGLGWLLAPTRLPVVKPVTDRLYKLFARNRVRLGRLAGRCPEGTCAFGHKRPDPGKPPA